jgi:hypothetical protein
LSVSQRSEEQQDQDEGSEFHAVLISSVGRGIEEAADGGSARAG